MKDPDDDPVIKHLRDQVPEADRHLIELVNRRLALVAEGLAELFGGILDLTKREVPRAERLHDPT